MGSINAPVFPVQGKSLVYKTKTLFLYYLIQTRYNVHVHVCGMPSNLEICAPSITCPSCSTGTNVFAHQSQGNRLSLYRSRFCKTSTSNRLHKSHNNDIKFQWQIADLIITKITEVYPKQGTGQIHISKCYISR